MVVKTMVTPEEYLSTAFEGTDPEYVEGEVVERAMPTVSHAKVQKRLILTIEGLRPQVPLSALTEVRHRVSETRYRIPDVAVYLGGEPDDEVPSHPPFIAVEIISPDDRFSSILGKLIEYAEWGVKHIWLVDPQQRKLSVYEDGALRNVDAFRIPEFEVMIPVAAVLPDPPASDLLKS